MIYRILIGNYSRKGNFTQVVERVVSYDGTAGELQTMMQDNYVGFDVKITSVPVINLSQEKKKEEEIQKKQDENFICNFADNSIKVKKQDYNLSKIIDKETLSKWENIIYEKNLIEYDIKDKIIKFYQAKDLFQSIEVYDVFSTRYSAALWFKGEIIKNILASTDEIKKMGEV